MRMCHFKAQNGPFVMNKKFFGTNHYYTFIYLLAFFIVQNFLKILTTNPDLWGCAIFGPKMVHLPQTNFFSEKNYIIFIHLLDPFILQNFKKILRANPELWGCAIFGPKMPPFVQNNIFWYKPLLLLSSIYLLALFNGHNLKKILQRIQGYEDMPFLGPKWSICLSFFFSFFFENY